MLTLDGMIAGAFKLIIHLVTGSNTKEIGNIHMRLVSQGDCKGFRFQNVLRCLMIFINKQRDLIHGADHAPRGIHDIYLACFVIGGYHQHRHRINSLNQSQVFLHFLHPPVCCLIGSFMLSFICH